ncbi:NF038396 family protein [Citricoccus sp. GCM10030269]|uniref:NF038396 family protein n=1 Tax=Citricoccus sp. GCM10030269 TaxID=3273388 RepID=UPI0036210333
MSQLLNKTSLTFIAFIACPILGLVTAVMGLVMIFTDNVIMGVVFLVLLTQVFIAGGVWATLKRRSLTQDTPAP